VPKSVQLAVADDESNVASTFGDEFEIAALVAPVHEKENRVQDRDQPGAPPLESAMMLTRLPDNSVFQLKLTAAKVGLPQVPEIVVQPLVVVVLIVPRPPVFTAKRVEDNKMPCPSESRPCRTLRSARARATPRTSDIIVSGECHDHPERSLQVATGFSGLSVAARSVRSTRCMTSTSRSTAIPHACPAAHGCGWPAR
jgi:hypothetical protein